MSNAAKEAEARAAKEYDEQAKNPEDYPYFILVPERYYLGLWCVQLPEPVCKYGAKGGDLVLLAQRKHDTETEWMLKLRFRYHLGEDPNDPWSGDDRKDWKGFRFKNRTEAELMAGMDQMMKLAAVGANVLCGGLVTLGAVDFLELRCPGDERVIEKMAAANKPWLHIRTENVAEHLLKMEQKTKAAEMANEVEKTQPGRG